MLLSRTVISFLCFFRLKILCFDTTTRRNDRDEDLFVIKIYRVSNDVYVCVMDFSKKFYLNEESSIMILYIK